MNIKRGILIAIALYISTLIVGITITKIFNVTLNSLQKASVIFWITSIIIMVLMTGLASIWYFNKEKRNGLEGLKLGVTFMLTAFVIDIIFFLTQEGRIQLINQYYSSPSFYTILILVIATCVFTGSQNHGKSSPKQRIESKNKKKSTKHKKN